MAGMDVVIVGGGIGGLATALSLHQVGIRARVYEAASKVAPLGVGINLQPSAVRELIELGLGAELASAGVEVDDLSLFTKMGQLIYCEKRGRSAGYRWPQYSIHRGRLQMLLLQAARDRIGDENIVFGRRFSSFEHLGRKVAATFIDPGTDILYKQEADILVGADGIHSGVRRQLYPNEGYPSFANQLLWRGAVEAEPFLGGRTMIIAGHLHQRIIVYPIGSTNDAGRRLTNWICQITVPEKTSSLENWNQQIAKDKILREFGNWQFPWLDMRAFIEQTPEVYEFPLVDREPLPAWSFGRVTLVGDAAHAMHPTGSQAGSQAIIDARVLTSAIVKNRNAVEALQNYERERRPVMNDIVLRNRRLGPELAMQLVEERAPDGFRNVEDVISRAEIETTAKSYLVAAGLDMETVNKRPSIV